LPWRGVGLVIKRRFIPRDEADDLGAFRDFYMKRVFEFLETNHAGLLWDNLNLDSGGIHAA